MRRPRIAVIGDTRLVRGALTGAGAIAAELGRLDHADVGFRSVAADRPSREQIEARLRQTGITTWLTIRDDSPQPPPGPISANLRMGDPIDITEIFDRDVVVLASRDVRLRRFLADLPVHTRPDVRILALLHFEDGVPPGERIEDVLRFDTIIGGSADFELWSAARDLPVDVDTNVPVLSRLHRRMHGTNVRAIVSWDEAGSVTLAEPLEEIVTIPPSDDPRAPSAHWAAFVARVALGMALRQPYREIVGGASRIFTRRTRPIVPGESPYT